MAKKIVIDGLIFGLQRAGGISRFWTSLLAGLDEHPDYKIILLLPKNRNVEWEELAPRLKRLRIIKRKTFRWEKRSFVRDSLYLTRMAAYLQPDLWHTTFFGGMPLWRCEKIATLYDMIPEILKIASPYERLMKERNMRSCNAIVTISESSARDMETFWPGIHEKTSVIPVCHTPTPRYPKERGEPYLLFVGKRGGYKNFLPTCQTLLADPRFEHLKIYVVGGEEESVQSDRVVQFGVLPHERVDRLVAGAEAVLFPSLYEGFGIPILEAFAQGVPVLAMRTSSIPEVTGEDYPLAKDVHALGDTLERLLNERERWIAHGAQRVDLFSRDKILSKLYAFYQERLHAL